MGHFAATKSLYSNLSFGPVRYIMVCEVSGSTSLSLLSLLKLSNHEKVLSTIHLLDGTVNCLAASGLSMFAV